MVAALLTIAICIGLGWPLSLILDRNTRPALHLAASFLLGSAAGGFLLFMLSIAGIPWSRATLLLGMTLLFAVALAAAFKGRVPHTYKERGRRIRRGWKDSLALAAEFITGVVAAGYALFATVGPTIEFDFVSIWGLKAKEFWYAGGIDWQFLENPFNEFAHVDYPILLPLIFDVQTLIHGQWEARWLGTLNVAFGLAALLAARSFLQDETGDSLLIAAGTLAMAGLAFSPWIGLAEGPLVAAGTVGLLYIRKGVISSPRYVLSGALFLGIAGSFKNEGIALIIAAGVGLLLTAPRLLIRLWPSLVIIGPWAILRRLHHLQGDLITGSVLERVRFHFADPGPMISAMTTYTTGKRFFWIGVVLAALLSIRRISTRERFLVLALFAQVGSFLIAYLMTPHDVTWHVRWSWERIVYQITLPVGFLSLVLLAPLLEGRKQPVRQDGAE